MCAPLSSRKTSPFASPSGPPATDRARWPDRSLSASAVSPRSIGPFATINVSVFDGTRLTNPEARQALVLPARAAQPRRGMHVARENVAPLDRHRVMGKGEWSIEHRRVDAGDT